MLPRLLVWAIICLVTMLWATNVVIGMINPLHSVDGLNLIFEGIVGGALLADRPAVRVMARRIGHALTRPLPPDDHEEVP